MSTRGVYLSSKRSKHPIDDIEDAIKYAEANEWKVKQNKSGYAWGRIFCPGGKRGDCIASIWSTPKTPKNHANQIIRKVKKCDHGERDE